jgi:hypothetical protein
MTRISVFLLAVASVAGFCTVQAPAALIFQDNFQGYTGGALLPSGTGSFTGSVGPGAQWSVSNTPPGNATVTSSADQSVNLIRSGGNGTAAFAVPTALDAATSAGQVVNISASVKTTSAVGSFISLMAHNGAIGFNIATRSFDVRFRDDGAVMYNTGTGSATQLNSGLTHVPGQFNSVTVLVDFAAGNFDLIVNGVQANNLTFSTTASNPGSLTSVVFTTSGNDATGAMDNVYINVPEPASIASVGMIGGGLLFVRRKRA